MKIGGEKVPVGALLVVEPFLRERGKKVLVKLPGGNGAKSALVQKTILAPKFTRPATEAEQASIALKKSAAA